MNASKHEKPGERQVTDSASEPQRRAWPCQHLDFLKTSSLNIETIHFCCFQLPGLWHLVTGALETNSPSCQILLKCAPLLKAPLIAAALSTQRKISILFLLIFVPLLSRRQHTMGNLVLLLKRWCFFALEAIFSSCECLQHLIKEDREVDSS